MELILHHGIKIMGQRRITVIVDTAFRKDIRAAALHLNYRGFLGSCRFIQFSLCIDIFLMKRNVVRCAVKQLCHALLGQPNRIILNKSIH